ncbi:phage head closure protein [Neisseria shayeganii]|uniref:phage head closure protein n=1 Tax=Neisseria shayeganii TaxID=607712 RepID=UPI001C716E5E|nr:phage head closure protein [Neisseria shayeganii]
MPKLKAGRLRHRITIKRTLPGGQDPDTGYLLPGTTEQKTVWAEVVPLSGQEFIAAAATQSNISVRMTIRPTRISTQDTVTHRGKGYNVRAVLPDPDSGREYYTLLCEAIE